MPTLRAMVDDRVMAYGTSESVKKAWDTRGRGRKAKEQAEHDRVLALPKNEQLRILPADDPEHDVAKAFTGTKKMVGMPPKQIRKQWKEKYDKFGDKLLDMHKKLDDPEQAKTTAGKMMHFLRSIAEWHDAWENLRNLVIEAGVGLWLAIKAGHYAHGGILNTMVWAHAHIAPLMHHIAAIMGSQDKSAHIIVKQATPGEHGTLAQMAYNRTLGEI